MLTKAKNYVIFRERINEVVFMIEKSNVIITSEFYNGKTIFLYECLPILSKKYNHIYIIDDPHSDYISDIEAVGSSYPNERIIFIIDDYFQYITIFEYLSVFSNKENIKFLLFSRSQRHEKQRKNLQNIGFNYKEIIVDILTENEVVNIINLIDSIGLWENNYSDYNQKYTYIVSKCERQISILLFNLLESPHIKDKIKNIISHLIEEDNKLKEITFVGLYLCMHDIDIDFHLISQLSSDEIYSYYIKNNSNFNQIFNIKDNKFISKSSIFCQK
ncbi:MAG: hypothetical protein IJU40_06460, partial [Desulfovibrionaceae bacterium]|nr:hypothetical protein [Desulfovibrionaceae bacterium]